MDIRRLQVDNSGQKGSPSQSSTTGGAATSEVSSMATKVVDDFDGLHADHVRSSDLINHPQIVAAIAAESRQCYVQQLLETDPVVGCALLYGTILLRGTQWYLDAIDTAIDTVALSESLSTSAKHLILHVVGNAIESRGSSELKGDFPAIATNRFKEARESLYKRIGIDPHYKIEADFPDFQVFKSDIDQIRDLAINQNVPDSRFFENPVPTIQNYLKAVFGILSSSKTPIQTQALEYFEQLDPSLLGSFKFGLENGYLANTGPSRLVNKS